MVLPNLYLNRITLDAGLRIDLREVRIETERCVKRLVRCLIYSDRESEKY